MVHNCLLYIWEIFEKISQNKQLPWAKSLPRPSTRVVHMWVIWKNVLKSELDVLETRAQERTQESTPAVSLTNSLVTAHCQTVK